MDLPQKLGRYEIVKRLGRGGMGAVYLAQDPQLGRHVAIKIIQGELDSAETRARFDQEARSIAALNHPNIVGVYDSGEFDTRPYVVLEYIEGRTLDAIIRSGEPMPLTARLRWLEDLCDGLQFAHDRGVVHRDIKPANLMVDHLNRLRILDFGIARMTGDTRTRGTSLLGTIRYMAPEHIRGEATDHRVDLFGAGAVAYELLAGRPAFPGTTDATIMHQILEGEPAPFQAAAGLHLDPHLEDVVRRALSKQPERRFQQARDLKHALTARSQSDPIPAVAATTVFIARAPTGRTNQATWIRYAPIGLLAVAIVIAVAIGVFVLDTPDSTQPTPTAAVETSSPPVSTPPTPIEVEPPRSDGARDMSVSLPATTAAGTDASAAVIRPRPATPSVAVPVPAPTSADTLFYANGTGRPGADVSGTHPGLRYQLLRQSAKGPPEAVDTNTVFYSGDSVRFVFQSNTDGYLYVFLEGSSGRLTTLFPDPSLNGGRNGIERLREYTIPSERWFRFDSTPGRERITVFLSKAPLAQLPALNAPVSRSETIPSASVQSLASEIGQRDMVLNTTRSSPPSGGTRGIDNFVVHADARGTAVTAAFELIHK